MAKFIWDKVTEKKFETGVSNGVLYLPNNQGAYDEGEVWNGLTTVTESPSGAESNKQYADNQVYVNIKSVEEFGCTIEAFTYPVKFEQCDGTAKVNGVSVGQQGRRSFGFSWQSLIGNDTEGTDHGYKIHLAYGLDAAPTEKTHTTVNESPEASNFSWEVTSVPTAVEGTDPVTGKDLKPTAKLTISSLDHTPAKMQELKDVLYGTAGQDGRLPSPTEVINLMAGALTSVETQAPTYDNTTDIVTIPTVTGVEYLVDGEVVPSGPFGPITEDIVVTARPATGYKFTNTSDEDWTINFS